MNMQAIYVPFLRFFRRRRAKVFKRVVNPRPDQWILDVGGYPHFWETMGCDNNRVTCLNVHLPARHGPLAARFDYVQADARAMPFEDDSFRIVFSNSVIEHLATFANQIQFGEEIRRVGGSYWVQTPCKSFPVEPHLIGLFVHFLPKKLQPTLIRWTTVWGLVERPSRKRIQDFLAEVRLLSYREMRGIFPDATILRERFCGITKSLIAVRLEDRKP